MLTRRKFLKGSMVTLLAIPVVGCSDDDSPPSGTGPSTPTCGLDATSTSDAGHVHTLCIPEADLSSPPSSGGTYSTSSNSGHTHSVTLSQSDLQNIAAGSTVMVTSSSSGHTHDFTLELP